MLLSQTDKMYLHLELETIFIVNITAKANLVKNKQTNKNDLFPIQLNLFPLPKLIQIQDSSQPPSKIPLYPPS